jgi:hypothetical protein
MSLVGRRKCLPKNFNPPTGPLLLPRDDDVLVGQAVLPRELNSVSGPVHVEDKGGGPVERLVEARAGHIMVGSEKRELEACRSSVMLTISSPPVFTTGAIWMLSRRQNWWPSPRVR